MTTPEFMNLFYSPGLLFFVLVVQCTCLYPKEIYNEGFFKNILNVLERPDSRNDKSCYYFLGMEISKIVPRLDLD